uniref:Immunoglobulin V-set domain-containing protein n=1 Tax=Erpetoichthys calabaricus TaxID=27687 RepID=A0A8C4STC2_ERPCA
VFLSDFIVCIFISAVDCLIAFIGKMVEIPCNLITTESLKVEDILVEWTISGGLIVHSFVKGENNLMNQDPRFEGRTRLILADLSRGDFSLWLSDVSIENDSGFANNNTNSLFCVTLFVLFCIYLWFEASHLL